MGSIQVFKRNVKLNIITCITVFVLGIDVALGEYRAIGSLYVVHIMRVRVLLYSSNLKPACQLLE